VPWNYPLFLAVGPLVGALAAGNRVMVKMSELTPAFSLLFADLVRQNFAPEEVTVINGGPDRGVVALALPFEGALHGGGQVGRMHGRCRQ